MLVDYLPELNGKLSLTMADSFVNYIMMMIVIIKKVNENKRKTKGTKNEKKNLVRAG